MRDNDTKLLQEAMSDVFKAVAKDLNMDIAGPGKKQEKCAPGYFWCPEDKECKPDKKVDEAITVKTTSSWRDAHENEEDVAERDKNAAAEGPHGQD